MNIRTVFIYFFLTVILVYLVLWMDNRYLCKNQDNKDENIFRHSITCGIINWIIIVYFISKVECDIPSFNARGLEVFDGKF